MKRKNSKCDYLKSRNENLKRVFFERLGQNGKSIKEVMQELTGVDAPRFFISEERAYQMLRSPGARKDERALPSKKAMLKEIRKRVEALCKENPGMTLKDAVWEVVNAPAPSFYLTFTSIKTIIYRSLRA